MKLLLFLQAETPAVLRYLGFAGLPSLHSCIDQMLLLYFLSATHVALQE